MKKSSTSTTAPAPAAPATNSSAAQSSDAGAKLRQAALERIQGASAPKPEEEEAEAKKKAEDDEAARLKKMKHEEEFKKKADEEKAAAAKKQAEEEAAAAARLAAERKVHKPEEAPASKPNLSHSAMLSRQDEMKSTETSSVDAPAGSDPASSASHGGKRRSVYSKEEMMRCVTFLNAKYLINIFR